MSFLQQPIQNKLSALLGVQVTFEKLNVSLLGGSIDARGVTLAGDDAEQPVLTIRRVRAEIAMARALKGEIVLRSLTVEHPVVSIVRRADGTTNLPRPKPDAEDELVAPPAPAEPEPADAKKWSFDIQRILLVDGEVSFRSDFGKQAGLHVVAQPILAELNRRESGLELTCIAESVSRTDQSMDLGQVRLIAKSSPVGDLSELRHASVDADLEVGEILQAKVRAPSVESRRLQFDARGQLDLGWLAALVPLPFPGQARFAFQGEYTPDAGLVFKTLNAER